MGNFAPPSELASKYQYLMFHRWENKGLNEAEKKAGYDAILEMRQEYPDLDEVYYGGRFLNFDYRLWLVDQGLKVLSE